MVLRFKPRAPAAAAKRRQAGRRRAGSDAEAAVEEGFVAEPPEGSVEGNAGCVMPSMPSAKAVHVPASRRCAAVGGGGGGANV